MKTSRGIYWSICAAFSLIVLFANIISAKMVLIPFTNELSVPAGLLIYPATFLLSDLVTEVFGARQAKWMVYIALAINLVALGLIQLVLMFPGFIFEDSSFWELSELRIFSSLAGYVAAQIVAIQLYVIIKHWTGKRYLWIRNNGSTCMAQIVDTLVLDILFFYWGMGLEMTQVWPIMLFSYAYKVFFSLASTPIFYLCVFLVRTAKRYFNREVVYGSEM